LQMTREKGVDLSTQIYCNVELNADYIEAVGFDMDFTLAQYNEAFDMLAYEGAKRKLHENLGYPAEVMEFEYSSDKFRRGLVIDKKRGNILKIDRHKYVRTAYHGLGDISRDDRKDIYNSAREVVSFTEQNFVNIDTIFLLVDALLFAHLVDLRDKTPSLQDRSYEQLYKDVRQSIDLCHRDGVIKDAVMKNPEKYILYDDGIVPMLQQLRKAGKKVFLLTNSLYDYTNVVMNYLVHGGGSYSEIGWQQFFDVAIVGACKPGFLTNDNLNLFEVDRQGRLQNVEDKDAVSKIPTGPDLHPHNDTQQSPQRVFQGGYWHDLHRMLDVSFGDKILYVGDHMYADILRSKRSLGWRTCLIIPELDHEAGVAKSESPLYVEVLRLRRLQYDLDEYIDMIRMEFRRTGDLFVSAKLQGAQAQATDLKQQVRSADDKYNRKFNSAWGQLFKAGAHDSRFAKQVRNYACLYTSRVSNLGFVSPNRPFRPVQDFMPHDQVIFESEY